MNQDFPRTDLPLIHSWQDLNVLIVPYTHVGKDNIFFKSHPHLSNFIAEKAKKNIEEKKGKATIYKFSLGKDKTADDTKIESGALSRDRGENEKHNKSFTRPSAFKMMDRKRKSSSPTKGTSTRELSEGIESRKWEFNVIAIDPTMIQSYGHLLNIPNKSKESRSCDNASETVEGSSQNNITQSNSNIISHKPDYLHNIERGNIRDLQDIYSIYQSCCEKQSNKNIHLVSSKWLVEISPFKKEIPSLPSPEWSLSFSLQDLQGKELPLASRGEDNSSAVGKIPSLEMPSLPQTILKHSQIAIDKDALIMHNLHYSSNKLTAVDKSYNACGLNRVEMQEYMTMFYAFRLQLLKQIDARNDHIWIDDKKLSALNDMYIHNYAVATDKLKLRAINQLVSIIPYFIKNRTTFCGKDMDKIEEDTKDLHTYCQQLCRYLDISFEEIFTVSEDSFLWKIEEDELFQLIPHDACHRPHPHLDLFPPHTNEIIVKAFKRRAILKKNSDTNFHQVDAPYGVELPYLRATSVVKSVPCSISEANLGTLCKYSKNIGDSMKKHIKDILKNGDMTENTVALGRSHDAAFYALYPVDGVGYSTAKKWIQGGFLSPSDIIKEKNRWETFVDKFNPPMDTLYALKYYEDIYESPLLREDVENIGKIFFKTIQSCFETTQQLNEWSLIYDCENNLDRSSMTNSSDVKDLENIKIKIEENRANMTPNYFDYFTTRYGKNFKYAIAGSYRRGKESSSDVDLILCLSREHYLHACKAYYYEKLMEQQKKSKPPFNAIDNSVDFTKEGKPTLDKSYTMQNGTFKAMERIDSYIDVEMVDDGGLISYNEGGLYESCFLLRQVLQLIQIDGESKKESINISGAGRNRKYIPLRESGKINPVDYTGGDKYLTEKESVLKYRTIKNFSDINILDTGSTRILNEKRSEEQRMKGGKPIPDVFVYTHVHSQGLFLYKGKYRRIDITIVPPEQWVFALLGWSGSTYYLRQMRFQIEKHGIPTLTSQQISEAKSKNEYRQKEKTDLESNSGNVSSTEDKLEELSLLNVRSQFLSSLAREELRGCQVTFGLSHHQLYLKYASPTMQNSTNKQIKRKYVALNPNSSPQTEFQETVLEAFHVAGARNSEADLLLYLGLPYFPAEMREAG